MIYLTFLAAFLLSGIAAYYSIIGLAAIFTGAFWPVVIMGGALEFAKLVTASWLYRNWKETSFLLKSYLTAAVVVLMLITSMGIFGFLSKSHIDSTLDAGANSVEIKTLNTQETATKEKYRRLSTFAFEARDTANNLSYYLAGKKEKFASGIDAKLEYKTKTLITFIFKYTFYSRIAISNLIFFFKINVIMKINLNILKINLCDTIIKKLILSRLFFNLYKN